MAQTTVITAGEDAVVKDAPGRVNWILISAVGSAAGVVWTIRDGGITGTVMARGTIEVANGSWLFPFAQRQGDPGIRCATSIAFTHTGADNTVFATLGIE